MSTTFRHPTRKTYYRRVHIPAKIRPYSKGGLEVVAHWLESELDYAEDCRALADPVSDSHREAQLDGLSIMFGEAHEALLGNDYRKIEKEGT